jgi:hypothetical protein
MTMPWTVRFHFDFEPEMAELSEGVRIELLAHLRVLERFGPDLGRPSVDTLNGSRHVNMKELRFKRGQGAWRFAFAFDPKRRAIVLCGGNKSGQNQKRFYSELIRLADGRFEAYLKRTENEDEKSRRRHKGPIGKKPSSR